MYVVGVKMCPMFEKMFIFISFVLLLFVVVYDFNYRYHILL